MLGALECGVGLKASMPWSSGLAHLEEQGALGLEVVSSSPVVGAEITQINK